MKKLGLALCALMISFISIAQSEQWTAEEKAVSKDQRIQASEGTYQLIFKDQASKDWFFATGVLMSSKYVGVDGITSYSDLLIVLGENRLKSEEQEFNVGENNELVIRVLSLDYIKSSQYQPLKEIIIKK